MHRFPRQLFLLIAVLTALLAAPGTAGAAEYGTAVSTGCSGWSSGGRDLAGNLYVPCSGSTLRIYAPTGGYRSVTMAYAATHVAPSPDGRYLYTLTSGGAGARRLDRQPDGNYAANTTFKFAVPAGWAARGWRVCGFGLATDGYGNVYVSNGGWCEGNPNQILKYRPDGSLVTVFGDYGVSSKWYPCGTTNCLEWNRPGTEPGKFQPNMMIAVTADGSRVWVADQNNQRIQVFARNKDATTYAFHAMWNGEGTPVVNNAAAIYGVALDAWGHGYVAMTTRGMIWRIDPELRNPVLVADRPTTRPHTVAVDQRGNVWINEWSALIPRTSAVPGPIPTLPAEPTPDVTAPVLSAVTAEATETSATTVRVTITASDANGIAQMRTRGASGDIEAATWGAYTQSFDLPLPTLGYNELYVQVRDAAENSSNTLHLVVRRIPVPDTTAPTLRVTTPATTTSRTVTLTVDAADAVGVTKLRIAGDDGIFGPWMAWSSGVRTLQHDLGATSGTRAATVEVQDASFNTSPKVMVVVAFAVPVVVVPTAPVVVVPGAPAPVPGGGAGNVTRDTVAPRIRSVRIPRRSCSRFTTIKLVSTDNVGLYWMRLANEDGRYGKWQRYRSSVRHTLTRGATRKLVTVQVADAAGNVGRAASVRTTVVRCGR